MQDGYAPMVAITVSLHGPCLAATILPAQHIVCVLSAIRKIVDGSITVGGVRAEIAELFHALRRPSALGNSHDFFFGGQ